MPDVKRLNQEYHTSNFSDVLKWFNFLYTPFINDSFSNI